MARSDEERLPRTVGRYQLWGELAAGGMATVHFGRLSGPVGFSRTVAIKKLHPQYAKDPDFVTMFLDEARICGRIRHPNVVPTLDVVALEGEIFIVMEYVGGEALSKLLKCAWTQGIPTPARVAAAIISSVLHGLHAAHITKDEHGRELGIVHRDVSPQNILVGTDGIARVLDFGVAKAAGRVQTTRDGQVKGKIAYMPPEQLAGGTVNHLADVYASAVVLWEALAGQRLFDGETEGLVLVRAIEGRIEPPSAHRSELSPQIDELVMRGLSRDPGQRYPTARDMAVAIEQTIGIASPSEVGEWVELVAGQEVSRRAARIAEIESASVLGTTGPRIALAPGQAAEVPSQVSSISVSRPAISVAPPRSSRSARVFMAFAVLVALLGFGLGALTMQGTLFGHAASPGAPNLPAQPTRSITLVGPPMAPTKAASTTTSGPATWSLAALARPPAPPPVAPAPPPRKPAAAGSGPACDPPYTLDPATGRKKYKMECLK